MYITVVNVAKSFTDKNVFMNQNIVYWIVLIKCLHVSLRILVKLYVWNLFDLSKI